MQDNDNPKFLLFLGAGASQFAGNSTFANFSDLLFNSKKRADEQLPFWDAKAHRFLEDMRDSLLARNKPLSHDNFIWLFNEYKNRCKEMLTDSVLRVHFLNSSSEISDFLTFKEIMNKSLTIINLVALHQYTKKRISQNDGENLISDEYINEIRDFYKRMAMMTGNGEKSNKHKLHIFTTNYDSLLEEIFRNYKETKVIDGMKEINEINIKNRPCDLKTCKEKYFSGKALVPELAWCRESYEDITNNMDTTIYYYKLHGCFAWFPCPNYYNESCAKKSNKINRLIQKPCIFKCEVRGRELFNPYYVNEGNLTDPCTIIHDNDAFGKHSPHEYYFNQFCEKINKTHCIIFIGCSFNDEDIARAILISRYSAALNKNKEKLKIISVNPIIEKEYIMNSFKAFASKLWINHKMVDDMIDIETIPLPFEAKNLKKIIGLIENILISKEMKI